jgi:hypothetical protein
MQEHAETQIHEPLLQFQERQSSAGSRATRFVLRINVAKMREKHRGSRSLANQLEKLSSRRHFQSFRPDSLRFIPDCSRLQFRVQKISHWTLRPSNQPFLRTHGFSHAWPLSAQETMRPIFPKVTFAFPSFQQITLLESPGAFA